MNPGAAAFVPGSYAYASEPQSETWLCFLTRFRRTVDEQNILSLQAADCKILSLDVFGFASL